MKKFRRVFNLILIFLVVAPILGCSKGKVGNGNVISQERQVENFSGIKVSEGIDLMLTQGDSVRVVVETDENLMELLRTDVSDSVLHIHFAKNVKRAKKRKVSVSFIDLERLVVNSGAKANTSEILSLNDFQVEVSSGGDANLELDAQNINASTSSGAGMTLKGKAENLKASASSGSDLQAGDLIANHVDASASSGGDVLIHAVKSLKANASSGGDVSYKGNPETEDVSTSSGGDVKKQE